MGSEFADFERALLLDKDKEHWGWFRWFEGGGDRIFKLSKSPFLNELGIPTFYILPEGYENPPLEKQFIQVEIEGRPYEEWYPQRFRSFKVKGISLISDRELINILPKPRLYLDEFRNEVTANFENAESDNLDVMLPLQVVSSPKNQFGPGGLTIHHESFIGDDNQDGGIADYEKRIINEFKFGILERIPTGFKEINPKYIYKIVSPGTERQVKGLKKKVEEVNLLTDPGTSLDIDFPLLHLQSRYNFKQKLSSDVVSYQLTALICQPNLRNEEIKNVENAILQARKRIDKFDIKLDLSPLAGIKIAEAIARLHLVQNNAVYKFLGKASDLIETQLKIREELYSDFLTSQIEAYADIRSAFSGIEMNSINTGKGKRSIKLNKFDAHLSRQDVSIYLEIRRMMQELSGTYVKRSDLKKSLKIDDANLAESLDMLRNRGYIIMLKNGTLIKVFDLGEFSGRFDEALPK